MLIQKLKIKLILLALLLVVPMLPIDTAKAQSYQNILITELQTGGWQTDGITEDPFKEFIELFNPNQEPVSLNGWQLHYLSANHIGGEAPTRTIATFGESHVIDSLSFFVISFDNYIADADYYYPKFSTTGQLPKTSGSLRLLSPDKLISDKVGYGSVLQFDGEPTGAPALGSSIQRCSLNSSFINSNNNKSDFSVYLETTPRAAIECEIEEQDPEPEPDGDNVSDNQTGGESGNNNPEENPAIPLLSCEGLVINEILPNPAGVDTDNEYIELYNPTNDYISLNGCKLQTTASTKVFVFNEIEVAPYEYIYFKDTNTGLTLPNSAGGTVYLISATNQEISTINYPGNMQDDAAWANFDNTWQQTFTPTPGLKNILQVLKPCPEGQVRNPETNRCISATPTVVATALEPCPAGQERNPATNRCRLVTASVATLTPCKPGQIRNPETNRCKNVSEAFTTLTPCKPGQERNPETNRCRNIVVASALKPCPAGQERNPETGRCRKVLPATSDSLLETLGVTDIPTSAGSTNGIIIALVTASAALAYGLWGWRQDMSNVIYKLRNKSKETTD
jgi:hypothetical protein